MHENFHPFTFGFHGCDRSFAERLVRNWGDPTGHLRDQFLQSENDYDWLGPGTYFYDSDPHRALKFATQKAEREVAKGRKFDPVVVRVYLELGNCLELSTDEGLRIIRISYDDLKETMDKVGPTEFRKLRNQTSGPLFRRLDCAVMRNVHYQQAHHRKPPYDTVRGTFCVGTPVYEAAGFFLDTHVQIAVLNSECIRDPVLYADVSL